MQNTLVRFPNEQEMLRRLIGVRNIDHLKEHFYPKLAVQAGDELEASGIAILFITAHTEYVENAPQWLVREMHVLLPLFVDSIIDDREIAEEAKKWINTALAL